MKVAFPIQDNQGFESQVHDHFGSASGFLVVDTKDWTFTSVNNQDREHAHGQCQPVSALGKEPVDALVVGGIGRGALVKLNAAGIKTYRAVEGSIKENLDLLRSGNLPEFTLEQTCAGHAGGGDCAH